MWPFDRQPASETLRIGRNAIERWVETADGLTLTGSQSLAAVQSLDAARLASTLRAVYATQPTSPITVVLESVWLPPLLAEVGQTLWKPMQVEALLRHRLNLVHGERGPATPGWDLRSDHRAGERFALGYGLPLPLKQHLLDAGNQLGLKWAAFLPSFAWGLERLKPARQWVGRTGWWAWPEQDRLIVARIAANRVVALNTCAACADEPEQVAHRIGVEMIRSGTVSTGEPISAATWSPARLQATADPKISWVTIASRSHTRTLRPFASPSEVHP